MLFPFFLSLLTLAAALPSNNRNSPLSFPGLIPRQNPEPVDVVPIAEPVDPGSLAEDILDNAFDAADEFRCENQRVRACQFLDLTAENWQQFDIDTYLIDFISEFGAPANFPIQFVLNQTPPPGNGGFSCATIDAASTCVHPETVNTNATNDCTFNFIDPTQTLCGRYLAPEATFVIQNYINLWQGTINHFHAVADAGAAILGSDFIDTIVDGLSPEKGSFLDAVFDLFKSLVIAILPIGGDIAGASSFIGKLGVLFEATGEDLIDETQNIFAQEQANAAIDEAAADAKQKFRVQVVAVVAGTQASMQRILEKVFVDAASATPISNPTQAIASALFQMARSGVFLSEIPSRESLAVQIQANLENWILSTTMKGNGWRLELDRTELLDDPADPGGACRGNGGQPVANIPCALFRNGNNQRPNNPGVVSRVNFLAAFQNAEQCQSGVPDFVALVKSGENRPGLPPCFYNFEIKNVDD